MYDKKIGIVPTIINRRSSINYAIDKNLIVFLKKIFPKHVCDILFEEKKNNYDLIVLSGGNTLFKFEKTKANKLRSKLDKYYFKFALRKKIPFLGICHGAQFIGFHFKSKIVKKKNHVGTKHLIKTTFNDKISTNSFHDYSIIELGNNLVQLAWTPDGSIEAFKHKKKKIVGIMWHPERYDKIKKFDLQFIKKYL